MTPLLVVLQGPSGGGKSTLARHLAAKTPQLFVVSTDDQVYDMDGNYCFDQAKHAERHQRTQAKAELLLRSGLGAIIDNTNIRAWECKPYVKVAVELGIQVLFVRCDRKGPNSHGVPDEVVARMRASMEDLTVQSVIESMSPYEIQPTKAESKGE